MGKAVPSWVSLHSVSGGAVEHYKGRYPDKSNHEAWLHRNYNSKNGRNQHHHQTEKDETWQRRINVQVTIS